MAYQLEGTYRVSNDTITNLDTKLTLQLRKRSKPSKNKPDYFLSVNYPTYTYISSVYKTPSKSQRQKIGDEPPVSFDNLSSEEPELRLYFDYQNQDYKLEKIKDTAKIISIK